VSSILNAEDSESPGRVQVSIIIAIKKKPIEETMQEEAHRVPALEMSHISTFGSIISWKNEESAKIEL
jgi:hypothetical protein